MNSQRSRFGALSPRALDLDKRARRVSAPAAAVPGTSGSCGLGIPNIGARHWVTTTTAAWRTLPSGIGYRIDTLPKGWRVVEAPWSEEPVTGWVPIEPRGFLQLCDLAKAPGPEDEPESMMMTPESSSKGGALERGAGVCVNSPQEGAPSVAGTRAALLALREEHVRLREANVQLREKEMKKRHDLDGLCRAREAAANELAQVREELAAEREELECSRQQRCTMEEKLNRCREVVASAVGSVDRLYGLQVDAEEDLSGNEEGPVVAKARLSRMNKAAELAEQAKAAGEAVSDMIHDLTDSADHDMEENHKAAPGVAAYDAYSLSHENAAVFKTSAAKKADAGVRKSSSLEDEKLASRQRAPFRERDLNLAR